MSWHAYSESKYGMFLNTEEADDFCRAFAKAHQISEEKESAFPEAPWEEIDLLDFRSDTGYAGRAIVHLDGKEHAEDYNDFCYGLFFPSIEQGSIFADQLKCYRDIEEMANEFREEYADYLPADFNYEAHMAHANLVVN